MTERPFIAPPDVTEMPPMNELVCFLDKDRGCGPDCMAYTLNSPGENYNDPWAHCLYLASLFRIGKHVVILAQEGADFLSLQKVASADAVRASNAPHVQPFQPPVPKKGDV